MSIFLVNWKRTRILFFHITCSCLKVWYFEHTKKAQAELHTHRQLTVFFTSHYILWPYHSSSTVHSTKHFQKSICCWHHRTPTAYRARKGDKLHLEKRFQHRPFYQTPQTPNFCANFPIFLQIREKSLPIFYSCKSTFCSTKKHRLLFYTNQIFPENPMLFWEKYNWSTKKPANSATSCTYCERTTLKPLFIFENISWKNHTNSPQIEQKIKISFFSLQHKLLFSCCMNNVGFSKPYLICWDFVISILLARPLCVLQHHNKPNKSTDLYILLNY